MKSVNSEMKKNYKILITYGKFCENDFGFIKKSNNASCVSYIKCTNEIDEHVI